MIVIGDSRARFGSYGKAALRLPSLPPEQHAKASASADVTAITNCSLEYPIIFWTPRGSLTAMAAAHPARGGIPHNTGAGMVRSWAAFITGLVIAAASLFG